MEPTKHEVVEIFNPFYEDMIEIDTEISELISLLWDLDIKTLNSCQENKPGIIWIQFPSFEAEKFLNIICTKHFDSVYNGIMQYNDDVNWQFSAIVDDMSEFINENDEIDVKGRPDFIFNLSIRFPKKNYKTILNRVKKYKVQNKKEEVLTSSYPDLTPIYEFPVMSEEHDNDLPF